MALGQGRGVHQGHGRPGLWCQGRLAHLSHAGQETESSPQAPHCTGEGSKKTKNRKPLNP